ncbi:hypothetical protein NJB18091_35310 [Mycobacterium marinum]|nr:hypothetical protein NJB18091_35310 [Mycobacterium marinum]
MSSRSKTTTSFQAASEGIERVSGAESGSGSSGHPLVSRTRLSHHCLQARRHRPTPANQLLCAMTPTLGTGNRTTENLRPKHPVGRDHAAGEFLYTPPEFTVFIESNRCEPYSDHTTATY